VRFIVAGGLREEHQQMGFDFAAKDLLGGLVVEFHHQRERLRREELAQGGLVGGRTFVVDAAFIELRGEEDMLVVMVI
jgi:hypothetical protein